MSFIKEIKNMPGYFISNTGILYSKVFHPIKNPDCKLIKFSLTPSPDGYIRVSLTKNKKRYFFTIHRLVAEAFIPNPENKPQVNHINGNKSDNRVENLEWNTTTENMQHASKMGLLHPYWCGKLGKNNPSSIPVIQIKGNVIINKFYGCSEAERHTGIDHRNISACCKGKMKAAGGYQWKYTTKE